MGPSNGVNNAPLGRGLGSLIPQKQPAAPPSPISKPAPVARPVASIKPPPIKPFTPPLLDEPRHASKQRLFDIPTGLIDPNPHQPRHHVSDESLDDLVQSIKQHGILQPLMVTKHDGRFQLIAGERRLRAAVRLGLPSVPAMVRDSHELEQLELAIVENVQRQDLNPVEEAHAYQQLADEFGLTQEEIATKVGKSRATIANALRLLSLPAEMLSALREGRLTGSHAKILLTAVTPNERQRLFRHIVDQRLPVRAASALGRQTTVRRYNRRTVDPLTQAAEDELRVKFGTKVTISKRDGRGHIAIDFYSDDEFRNLFEQLR
ncbi:MAG: ParB/RepB/Spo0J family partition protein [Patescibacteria group bacterium]